jgi:hypothetical protein
MMKVPNDSTHNTKHHEPKRQTLVAVLAIIATVVSLASAGFSAFVYFNTPLQIHNYVQSHKGELKGEDGRDGSDGMNGRNGTNSYSPTRCSSYDYGYGYSSTNCY